MSRISQDFINSVGYLYEEINIQQNDFLNEESEHYDEELTEIVEDIISTISSTMVCEGYSAEGIIGFLADSSEENIIEKYLNYDENILIESVVSEDYISEQLEIFDFAINEGIGSLIGKVAKGAVSLAGRVASKPARMAVAKKMMQSKDPTKTAAAVDRLARMKLNKAGAPSDFTKKIVDAAPDVATKTRIVSTAPAVGKIVKGVQKAKDIAQGAKKALPGIAKGAGIFGLGAAGGYVGAKMAGAGSGTKSTESPKPSSTSTPSTLSSSSPSGGGGGSAPSGGGARKSKSAAPATLKQTGNKTKDMETWAKANPRLAQAEKLRSTGASREEINKVLYNKGTAASKASGQSEMEKSAEEIRRMANSSRQRQGSLMGGPEGPGKVDTKAVDTAITAEQERQKKRLEQQNNTSMTAKESYEPYDIILNYLMFEGHADTTDEANYIMLEMDEKAIGTIIEEYEDYLLAEEIQEWVNSLLDEGYDLSEYSWDEVVEYYVTEANRGDDHVTSSMYMSKEPETKAAKVRRRQKRDGLPDNASHQGDDKDYDRQWAHKVSRGRKKLKPRSSETLEGNNKNKNTATGKYAAMQRRKGQGLQ